MISKNTSATSDTKLRLKFRDGIRGARDKMAFLIDARTWLPISLFTESIEWIRRQPKLLIALHSPFPEEVQLLGAYKPYGPGSFRREVEWAKVLIRSHWKKIQRFIELREIAQKLVLQGHLDEAGPILDSIRKELGVSFWWIKHRLASYQIADGIEAQKNFATEIKGGFGNWNINSFIVHQVSVRNEPSVTPSRFINQLKEEINQFPFSHSWKQTLKYHVLGGEESSVEDAIHILRHSLSESIIDTYEALLHVARTVSSHLNNEKEALVILSVLKSILTIIDDKRLDTLIYVLDNGASGKTRDADLTDYKSLITNENTDSLFQNLNEDPTALEQYPTAAIIRAKNADQVSIGYQLVNALTNVFSNTDEVDIYASEIGRIALAFPGFEVIGVSKAIAARQLSPTPLGYHHTIGNSIEDDLRIIEQNLIYAISPVVLFHPFLIRYLPRKIANNLIKSSFETGLINQLEFPWIYREANLDTPYYTLEMAVNKSLKYIEDYQYTKAIEESESLRNCGIGFYEVESVSFPLK